MGYSELQESPQMVGDQNWNLSNPRANNSRAQNLLKHKPDILETFSTSRLVHLSGNVGGQFGLISGRTGLLEYYVHYEINSLPTLGKCATQIKLWRSITASVQGLASKVFDTYLLAWFDTVVSDSYHTTRGQEFWTVQLAGHSSSHTIGLLNGNKIELYNPTISVGDWLASVNGWGDTRSFRQLRFFISNLSREVLS